jgi:hypothetical protein
MNIEIMTKHDCLDRIKSDPDITISESTAMQAGSCNSCGRTTQTNGDYSVRDVQLRNIAFRVCPKCAEALASLLRGEIPGGQR